MQTYAIIFGGVVINTILWDPVAQPTYVPVQAPGIYVDVTALSPQPDIGWTYDGTNFASGQ